MPAEPPPEPSPPGPGQPDPRTSAHDAAARALDARALKEAERRLNSPTPLTMRLLGVIFVATMVPWIAAKAACNLRESPVRQPHDPPTATLAKNAKSAALELAHRAATGRYREAAELARGDVAKELLDADARCTSEPAPCEQRRARAERTFTRAVVASRGPAEASVRTESLAGDDPPERFAMHLAHDEGRWYVVRRSPLQGPIDAPVSPDEVVSPVAVREVHGAPNMSVAPPHDHPHGALGPHGAIPHGAAPHGSAPSSGAPSGTGDPPPAPPVP
jgi:hypothetical protein